MHDTQHTHTHTQTRRTAFCIYYFCKFNSQTLFILFSSTGAREASTHRTIANIFFLILFRQPWIGSFRSHSTETDWTSKRPFWLVDSVAARRMAHCMRWMRSSDDDCLRAVLWSAQRCSSIQEVVARRTTYAHGDNDPQQRRTQLCCSYSIHNIQFTEYHNTTGESHPRGQPSNCLYWTHTFIYALYIMHIIYICLHARAHIYIFIGHIFITIFNFNIL